MGIDCLQGWCAHTWMATDLINYFRGRCTQQEKNCPDLAFKDDGDAMTFFFLIPYWDLLCIRWPLQSSTLDEVVLLAFTRKKTLCLWVCNSYSWKQDLFVYWANKYCSASIERVQSGQMSKKDGTASFVWEKNVTRQKKINKSRGGWGGMLINIYKYKHK